MDTQINSAISNKAPDSSKNGFYLHVSSRASRTLYPNNNGHSFKYQCPDALTFPLGEMWECALLELVYDAYGDDFHHDHDSDHDDDSDHDHDSDEEDEEVDIEIDESPPEYTFAIEVWKETQHLYTDYTLPSRVYTSVEDLTEAINELLDEERNVWGLVPVSSFLKFYYDRQSNEVVVLFGQKHLHSTPINVRNLRLYYNTAFKDALGLPSLRLLDASKGCHYTLLKAFEKSLTSIRPPCLPAVLYDHTEPYDESLALRSEGEVLVFMDEALPSFFRGSKRKIIFKGSEELRQSVHIPEYVTLPSGTTIHELSFTIEGSRIKQLDSNAASFIKLHFRRASHHGTEKL